MRKNLYASFRFAVSLALFLLLPFASQTADVPLQVIQKSPVGENNAPNPITEITVTFSQPMVNLTDNKTMSRLCPLQFTPPIEGSCLWRGTNTLVFIPAKPLPPARHYSVLLPKGTKSQVSGAALDNDVAWAFNTLRLQVSNSLPSDQEGWVGLDPLIFVSFNLNVDSQAAVSFVTLKERAMNGAGSAVSLIARYPTAEELKKAGRFNWTWNQKEAPKSNLVFETAERLKVGQAYYLVIKKGCPSLDGEEGLPNDRVIQFSTLNNFQLIGHSEVSGCVEQQRLNFIFSNPVNPKDLASHLTIESGGKALDTQAIYEMNRDRANGRVTYSISNPNLIPNATYQVTVKGELKDLFGNILGSDVAYSMMSGDRCAHLQMTQGFGILESYLKHRLPVTSMNVSDVPMKIAAIPENKLIPLLTQCLVWKGFDYRWGAVEGYGDEDEGEGDDEGEGEYQPRAANPKPVTIALEDLLTFNVDRPWSPHIEKNLRARTFIDLDEALPNSGKNGGLVYSELTYNRATYRAVDDITPLGITLKTSPDSSLAFVTYLKSGGPANGIPVEVRGNNNKVLWTGTTDRGGFAEFPGWRQLGITDWDRERPSLWVFAHHKDGTAVLSSAMQGGIDPWRFNIYWEENPPSRIYRGTVFTERGVYRPGETVHMKGIIRKIEKADWALPALKNVQFKLTDPSNAQALGNTLTVSALGTFHLDYVIPPEARTGEWRFSVTRGNTPDYRGLNLNGGFRVEDYKPAAFEVKAIPGQDFCLDGDTLQTKVEGWYLFGAPMAGADYETTVNLMPAQYEPPHWEDYDFSGGWWERWRNAGRNASSGTGKLDAQGDAQVTTQLDGSGFKGPFKAVLEASVTSPDRQKLFTHSTVIVHKSNLYVGIKPSSTFIEKGQAWKASVVCVTPLGKTVAGIPLKVQMKLHQWISSEKAGFGGRLQWFSEVKESVEKEWTITSKDGPMDFSYEPKATGEYFLTISAADEKKRPAESAISFYVAGKGEAWWARNDNDIIELVPDKKEYKPGDTARIMVKSPYDASHAMVSVERETILNHWSTDLAGGADFITVPITDKCLPNIYVSVMLVRGRSEPPKYDEEGLDLAKPQAKFGYLSLRVNPGGRRLSVKVNTDQADYRPGQKVQLNLQALDEAGKAAPCEMMVAVVDEGVLSLTAFQTPDPFEVFYGPRSLQVLTSDSRLWVIGQRSFGEKGQEHGGGGGAEAALEGIDLRSNFIPTAYYNPAVATDPKGQAKISFKLPDNLSRFRVMAVALDEKRFGNGEGKLTVNKHLVLRPSLPRFARLGDDFQGGVVVHNDSGQDMKVLLDAHADSQAVSMDPGEPLVRHLALKPGAAQEVLFHFHAGHLGKADFKFRASSGEDTDGLEWTLAVEAPTHLETVATSGATTQEAVEQMVLPDGAVTEVGGVRWAFSSTALAGLQDAARFLLEYPYGCLEQRMSKVLPIVTGGEMLETFGLGKLGDLKQGVQMVMDHVGEYQNEDGGFHIWPGHSDMADPWVTAYAMDVMHAAKEAGYAVPAESTAKAREWMNRYLSDPVRRWAYPYSPAENLETNAYVLYADAVWGEKPMNYFDKLFDTRDQLPVLGLAYLVKAASHMMPDDSRTHTLAQELLNKIKVEPQSLHFEEAPSEGSFWWTHETTVNNTAICLQALLEAQGGFPGDEKAVKWLIGERGKNQDCWRTTQENGSVLWALGDYYRHYEKEAPDFTAQLTQTGSAEPLWSATFQGRSLLTQIKELTMDSVFGQGVTARFKATKTGEGRLYYSASMRYYQSTLHETAESAGYVVEKTIAPLEGSMDHLKAGTRAVVTLRITTTQEHNFVAVNDPLPGGFEIVDPSYAVEGKDQQINLSNDSNGWGWYWGNFNRNEKYDDRIQIFADFLNPGVHTYSYLIQATTPGRFAIPSTWVESMYEPEVFGRSATSAVTIEK
jgi:hypothetical protein